MTTNGQRPAMVPHALGRLRLRLTAWYVGTFFAILTLLGIGMFATITKRFDQDLNASLIVASHELTQLVSTRERHIGQRRDGVADAVDDLRIPDRTLFLTDTAGVAVSRGPIAPWVREIARAAWTRGGLDTSHAMPNDRVLRLHAERFLAKGGPFVAIAVADEIEVEDRYASLIAAFGAAALASLVLVAAGGWFLARQSTDPVERAIVHMRRFMADAAHELRTPLTVVRSRAEIALQRTRAPEEYVLALRGIERESARLGRIVEDLLMLARADTGERPIEHQRIFLDDVTLDAAEAARAIADRKAVRVEVDSFEEAPVVGDPDLLRQLVMILLDNAVKFTPVNGVVHVGVKATPFAATLTVSDTGVGITRDQLPHVFERFYRGDPSRARAQSRDAGGSEGAGLGLAIAQWICNEHGGTIRIDSEPGTGTAVVVELPAAGQAQNHVMFQTGSQR